MDFGTDEKKTSGKVTTVYLVRHGTTAWNHGTAIQAFLNFAHGIPAEKVRRYLLFNVSVS